MTLRYAYSLHERATRAIIAADDSERAELLALFEALAREPGRRGAEQVTDEAGRANEVTYTHRFRRLLAGPRRGGSPHHGRSQLLINERTSRHRSTGSGCALARASACCISS